MPPTEQELRAYCKEYGDSIFVKPAGTFMHLALSALDPRDREIFIVGWLHRGMFPYRRVSAGKPLRAGFGA